MLKQPLHEFGQKPAHMQENSPSFIQQIFWLTQNHSRMIATQLSPGCLHAAFDCRAGKSCNFAPNSQPADTSAAFQAC